MAKISEDKFQDLLKLSIENSHIKFSLLPEVGGKFISLVCRETAHEYIWSCGRPYKKVPFDGNYMEYDISGIDECFPTIAKCYYPEKPWTGVIAADHGEVWTLPWKYEQNGENLRLSVYGVRFPYRLEKTISLDRNTIKFEYKLTNLSPFDFKYIWAIHPMLKVVEGTKIFLPGTPRIRTNWSKHERFGKLLYETTWPMAHTATGEEIDLSIIRKAGLDQATKIFTTALGEGWCGLHDPNGDYIKMSFPADKVPYVGVWINEGGWPFNGPPGFQMAFEPSTGCPDSLATAIERNECACINGDSVASWYMNITVGRSENPFG